jgi:hypothetical protein
LQLTSSNRKSNLKNDIAIRGVRIKGIITAFTDVELNNLPCLKKLMEDDIPKERNVAIMVTIMTEFLLPSFLMNGESMVVLP